MTTTNLTEHAHRIAQFMLKARQDVPNTPTLPNSAVRKLRASLILEEALETVRALGFNVDITLKTDGGDYSVVLEDHRHGPDLVEIADGCADVSVVTIGTLLACGIEDKPLLELIDKSNLSKFDEGYSFREDGKLLKSPKFVKPKIAPLLGITE